MIQEENNKKEETQENENLQNLPHEEESEQEQSSNEKRIFKKVMCSHLPPLAAWLTLATLSVASFITILLLVLH